MKRRWLAGLAGLFALADAANGAATAPAPWLAAVASQTTPRLPGDVPAYVLLDDTVMTVAPDGVVTERRRSALRVLTQKGDDYAIANLPYLEKVDKLVGGTAWLVREGRSVKSEPLNRWVDVCMISDGTVFTERRNRMISFPRETLAADVFGYETTASRPLLLPHLSFEFSVGVPVGSERFELILPKGWGLEQVARGEDVPVAVIDPGRNSWTWELRNRPYLPDEEWTPRVATGAPRLLLTLLVPDGAPGGKLPRIKSWGDIGTWVDELGAGQCDSDAALIETAKRLATASPDRVEMLRAICTHVQRLRYVAVNSGLGLGFGYKPRKATEVLQRGYGDCKDKANLLRALLREAGITAHLVAIESGRRHPTVAEWPSVGQFNHAISAIEVDATVDLPAVVTVSDGRRLLLFDPTDEYTILGDLPWYLQGATGLLVHGAQSFLVDVPELPHDVEWTYETKAHLVVAADGTATGRVAFTARRQAGRGVRAAMRNHTPKEISEMASRSMSSMLRGVIVRDPKVTDDATTGDLEFAFDLTAPGVFQPGPGGIFMMRLDVFNRDSVPQLGTKERVQPVEIRPIVHTEEVTLELPAGFAVDDFPKRAREEGAYGVYERSVEVRERGVVLRRELRLLPQIVVAGDYPKVRTFLTAAARADKAAVVLRRAP